MGRKVIEPLRYVLSMMKFSEQSFAQPLQNLLGVWTEKVCTRDLQLWPLANRLTGQTDDGRTERLL